MLAGPAQILDRRAGRGHGDHAREQVGAVAGGAQVVGDVRAPAAARRATSQFEWSMSETSTSNSPDSAISWKTRGKTTRSSSIAQQSAGLPTSVKFGNSCLIRARQLVRQELQRDPRLLGLVGEVLALAARVGDGADPPAAGRRGPREHLEVLQPGAEVVAADGVVVPQHRRERPVGSDQRAGVRERRPGAHLGRADLEHDGDLAGLGDPPQRLLERRRPAHGLQEQADHAALRILREVRRHVGDVGDGLVSCGDDGAESDPRAERDQDLADRAGVRQRRDRAAGEVLGQRPDPR